MTTSPSEAKEDAIARAELHAAEEWKEQALAAVRLMALQLPEFTTSEVWPEITGETHDGRAMGAIMRKAYYLGFIEPTERWLQSDSVVNHGRPQRVWRSKIWKGEIQSPLPLLLESL